MNSINNDFNGTIEIKIQDGETIPSKYAVTGIRQQDEQLLIKLSTHDSTKPRVAIFAEFIWAFGRIYHDLVYFMPQYAFCFFDWGKWALTAFLLKHIYLFDIILSNTSGCTFLINNSPEELHPLLHARFRPTFHSPRHSGSSFYAEHFVKDVPSCKHSTVYHAGISNDEKFTPCGVNPDLFYMDDNTPPFPRGNPYIAGYVGAPNPDTMEIMLVKRPYLFRSICTKANVVPHYIHGKQDTKGLYDSVDFLIITSQYETGPLSPFEAALCFVPTIAMPVGNLVQLKSIKLFRTVDQAVSIIKSFQENPLKLKEYAVSMYAEIVSKWTYAQLIVNWHAFLGLKQAYAAKIDNLHVLVSTPVQFLPTIIQSPLKVKDAKWIHGFETMMNSFDLILLVQENAVLKRKDVTGKQCVLWHISDLHLENTIWFDSSNSMYTQLLIRTSSVFDKIYTSEPHLLTSYNLQCPNILDLSIQSQCCKNKD